jgi:hypothetical protein
VAGDAVIETYLGELDVRLRWRVDRRDVIDELRDHLLSACAASDAAGQRRGEIERAVIDRIGPVDVVADAMLNEPRARLAIPTRVTRSGGLAAIVAGAAWPLAAAAWSASVLVERRAGRFDGAPQWLYASGAGALWMAAIMTALAVGAICRRHGARRWNRRVAVGCAGAAAATTALPWLVIAWAALLAAAGVIALCSSPRSTRVSRGGIVAIGIAWPVAGLSWAVLRLLRLGWHDEWGSYPLAIAGAVTIGAALTAIGCVAVGYRLLTEMPVAGLRASG